MGRSAAAVAAPRRGHARPAAQPRRRSGAAPRASAGATGAGAVAQPLPVRVAGSPFVRVLRARGGGVLDALLSGRGWIALVFLLLGGIVFFNVDLLQMNRDIARNSETISALKRENAGLRADEARLASSERIQEKAAELGLVLPAPGEVRYLKARPTADAKRAAGGIPPATAEEGGETAAGETAAGDTASGDTAVSPDTGAGAIDPVTGFPVDPATGRPVYDPVTGAPLDPATGQPLDLSALAPAEGTSASGATAADPAATGSTPAGVTATAPGAAG